MRGRIRFAGLLGLEAGVIVAIALSGDLRTHVFWFLLLFAAASGAYVLAALLALRLDVSVRLVVVVAVALRLPMFFTQPSLSDDVWRYIHDGRAQLAGTNPYRYPPADPATLEFRGPEYNAINHPELRTIYPPLAQYAFRIAAAAKAPLFAWRVLLLAAEIMIVIAGAVWLRRRGARAANLALYAWHPLAIVEGIGSAHLEPLAIALLTIALALAGTGRPLRAGFALAASVATKLIAAPLMMVASRDYRLPFTALVGLALLYLPFLAEQTNVLGSLSAFANRWESNGSIYPLVNHVINGREYRFLAAALLLAGVMAMALARVRLENAALLYFVGLFMLAPVVHPWYLLWVLAALSLRVTPLDRIGIAALLWSVTVVCAYVAHQQQLMHGEWRVPTSLLLVEYLPFYFLLIRALPWRFRARTLIPAA